MGGIEERIKDAYRRNGCYSMSYQALARAVFPEHEYPRAWNYSSNGGPPGCYMALSAAIRKMGLHDWDRDGVRTIRIPSKMLEESNND